MNDRSSGREIAFAARTRQKYSPYWIVANLELHTRSDTQNLRLALELMKTEFAYMDGLIDPPSSIHRLTLEDLISGPGELWTLGTPPVACVVMTPRTDVLYVSKLSVASESRKRGIARRILDGTSNRARELGLSWIELQTRVELVANQQAFTALGFVETERTAHPGYDRPTSITYRRAV